VVGLLALTAACTTAKDKFYGTVFACDVNATEDQCGTTSDGKPMVCYNGAQLGGGKDFCAARCDPAAPADDLHSICAPSRGLADGTGALLQVCRPLNSEDEPEWRCPEGLQCFRTDLLKNEGVCLMMLVCTENKDCPPERNACGTTILSGLPSTLHADHLACVNPDCSETNPCPPGESCLSSKYQVTKDLNMCVPNCDGRGLCPPGFGCAQTPTAQSAPAMCLPGLPGVRCQSDLDCLLGTCFDTGAGFSECVFGTCTTDEDCLTFASITTFLCIGGEGGGTGHCLATKPFNGADCSMKDDQTCPEGQECNYYSPYVINQEKGECRVPCDANKKCPARGGIPHVCLDDGDGGCYPGTLGLPCTDSSECVGHLECLPAPQDPRTIITSPKICTIPCAMDTDCMNDPITGTVSVCGAGGVCRLTGTPGQPCTYNEQCANRICLADSTCM
jgi:hypothetical protein